MTRKRKSIDLRSLSKHSAQELNAMVKELCDVKPVTDDDARHSTWARRFAASGKGRCAPAPRIRMS
jgi:hypothetical protein